MKAGEAWPLVLEAVGNEIPPPKKRILFAD
jgi:hypothetical protein